MGATVIVIGAGLAGAAATAKLAAAGSRVTLIEARERVGGRAYARPFAGVQEPIEMGGAWIAAWHGRIRALAARHGLAMRPRHAVMARLFATPEPLSYAERFGHERAIARVAADSLLLKSGYGENEKGESLRGVSFADYLGRLALPSFTHALFSAWWVMSGNGDHRQTAASEFLASSAYDGGLTEGMILSWADTVVPSMDVLAGRMIEAASAATVFSAPATEIRCHTDHVEVIAGGIRHTAQGAVVALGVNQMRGLAFHPGLPAGKRDAIHVGHCGRCFKLWAKMRGLPIGTLATGDGAGIEFAFAERFAADGETLVVAFGIAGGAARPDDPGWVAAELAKLLPGARYLAHDWHDWVNDPYARGTWVAAPAGHETGLEADNWRREGRLGFASSDYAPDQAGWFEGAVISGEGAADEVLLLLSQR